jgi:hypothetical protein
VSLILTKRGSSKIYLILSHITELQILGPMLKYRGEYVAYIRPKKNLGVLQINSRGPSTLCMALRDREAIAENPNVN